jgi:uncharacterized repeat protein (TIGR01451 family)
MTPSNNAAYAHIPIVRQVDLRVTVSDNVGASSVTGASGVATAGGTIVYTLTVTNNGPSDAVDLSVNAYMPGVISYTYQLIDSLGNPPYTPVPGILIYGYPINGNLPPGGTDTFIITAHLYPNFTDQFTGPLVNTFSVFGGYELLSDDNTASVSDSISF